jgi:hypothetical protein
MGPRQHTKPTAQNSAALLKVMADAQKSERRAEQVYLFYFSRDGRRQMADGREEFGIPKTKLYFQFPFFG